MCAVTHSGEFFRGTARLRKPMPAAVGSKEYTRVLALGAGLPIKVGDDVVGAVGVSGSPGKDDDCSKAGIDKVADQLR